MSEEAATSSAISAETQANRSASGRGIRNAPARNNRRQGRPARSPLPPNQQQSAGDGDAPPDLPPGLHPAGGYGQQNGSPGRLHGADGSAASGKKEQGRVVSMKDSFGFIRGTSRKEQLFFHVSEVRSNDTSAGQGPRGDLQSLLHVGDEVEFTVGDSSAHRGGTKLVAKEVRQLPKGTIAEFSGNTSPYPQRRSKDVQANHKFLGEGPRETGIVTSLKAGFGFIMCLDRNAQLFYHSSEVRSSEAVAPDSEVSFVVARDDRSGKDVAVSIKVLPPGTLQLEVVLPGRMQGQVLSVATASFESKQDGQLVATDENGVESRFTYDVGQVEGDATLADGDLVDFQVVVHKTNGQQHGKQIRLLARGAEQRELGQVKETRANFGFIKCCVRNRDVAFHVSEVEEGVELQVGDDVEFGVRRDPDTGKLQATRVVKMPLGTAVFETTSDKEYVGIVMDALQQSRGYGCGVIEYLDESGETAKLTYGPLDLKEKKQNPRQGDQVTFKIAVNLNAAKNAAKAGGVAAKLAGRRATKVAPVVLSGVVTNVKGTFGFIQYPLDLDEGPGAREWIKSAKDGGAEAEAQGGSTVPVDADAKEAPSPAADVSPALSDASSPEVAAASSSIDASAAPDLSLDAQPALLGEEMQKGVAAEGGVAVAAQNTPASPGSQDPGTAGPGPEDLREAVPGLDATAGKGGDLGKQQAAPTAAKGQKHKKEKLRAFFHSSEVHDNIQLRPGDEVKFVLARNPTSNEINAVRVRRVKEGPATKQDKEKQFVVEVNPDRIKFQGNPAAPKGNQQVRIARGPDGTRGFSSGRGRALLPPIAQGPSPQAPGSALVPGAISILKKSPSGRLLNPSAKEFVPLGSQASGVLPVDKGAAADVATQPQAVQSDDA